MNYVIATYNGSANRKHTHPLPENILSSHIKKLGELNHNLKRITIMKAKCEKPVYKNYYKIEKSNLPIKEIDVENYGYSMGQWLKAYELDKTYDYYLFIEDDYCPNMDNFDEKMIKLYKEKFPDKIGLLTSVVEGKGNGEDGSFPLHAEGIIFVSRQTMEKLYNKWNNRPRDLIDKLNSSIVKCLDDVKRKYKGGYYQLTFSLIFTFAGIKHDECLGTYNHFYWDDYRNYVTKFTSMKTKTTNFLIKDISKSIFIPIQLKDRNCIKKHTTNNL